MKAAIIRTLLCAVAVVCLHIGEALAQADVDYPNRVVRLVVPYPPGGGPDVFTRVVADKLAEKWKQPVIVENRVGGAGNVGAEHVAHSDPDGYTLLAAAPGPIAINGSLFKTLNYDPAKWDPVSVLTRQPIVLGARKSLPATAYRN